jgi:hypothetical protein
MKFNKHTYVHITKHINFPGHKNRTTLFVVVKTPKFFKNILTDLYHININWITIINFNYRMKKNTVGVLCAHCQISVWMIPMLGNEQHIILVNNYQMLMHFTDCSSSSMRHEAQHLWHLWTCHSWTVQTPTKKYAIILAMQTPTQCHRRIGNIQTQGPHSTSW